MISAPDRRKAVKLIDEAKDSGARLAPACRILGLSVRTYQRWTRDGSVSQDKRPEADRPRPEHALSKEERQKVLDTCNSEEFASLPPGQIVPKLADRGTYLASEATFYRILREEDQQHHRGRAKTPRPPKPPSTHSADGPNEVLCWDITWLPGPVRGMFFYLYLIMDLYSRKIVGWEVHADESSKHARELVQRTVLAEGCIDQPIVLHGDNGSPLKAETVQVMLERLGITPSYSRPRVSDDNAFVESLFRTCKYVPSFPRKGFESLTEAREWVFRFASWYNHEHQHSGINFVTPHERHTALDHAILAKRQSVYETARRRNPGRWSGNTRNWTPIGTVWLNPEREKNGGVRIAA